MQIERIGRSLEMPERVRLRWDCLIVLSRSLAAVAPEEGCALLLGNGPAGPLTASPIWHVEAIWPCCNVWRPGLEALPEEDGASAGAGDAHGVALCRRHRFAVDPREQLHAQRWARRTGMQVLGSAHSHPEGDPIPSLQDQRWAVTPGLMVIMGAQAQLAAWWLEAGAAEPLPLEHTEGQDC